MTWFVVTCVCSCSFLAVQTAPVVSESDPRSARCSGYLAPVADTLMVPVMLYFSALVAGGKGTGNTKGLIVALIPPTPFFASAVFGYVANGVCRRRLARRASTAPAVSAPLPPASSP